MRIYSLDELHQELDYVLAQAGRHRLRRLAHRLYRLHAGLLRWMISRFHP